MENENQQKELILDEIGYFARIIDTDMTILERMKIKKTTRNRILGAITVYTATMILFTLLLD